MLEFFGKIAEYISIAVEFIINMLKSLLQLLLIVPKTYAAIVEVLALFPPFITVPIIGLLSLALIIAIINKFGG